MHRFPPPTAVSLGWRNTRSRRDEAAMRPPLDEVACLRCGVEFVPSKRGHVYCSADCRHQGEREPSERPPADPEQVRRLFDARDPSERVRPDDWHPAPLSGFAELDACHTLERRRRWFHELRDRGLV